MEDVKATLKEIDQELQDKDAKIEELDEGHK